MIDEGLHGRLTFLLLAGGACGSVPASQLFGIVSVFLPDASEKRNKKSSGRRCGVEFSFSFEADFPD